jgi:Eukaryotic aspartyl protease
VITDFIEVSNTNYSHSDDGVIGLSNNGNQSIIMYLYNQNVIPSPVFGFWVGAISSNEALLMFGGTDYTLYD